MTKIQDAPRKTNVRKPRAMKPNKHAKAEIAKVESWMKGTKTVFSPEILERQAGVSFGPSKELQDLRKVLEYDDLAKQLEVERNRVQGFLQERHNYKLALGEHLRKPTKFSPEKLDDWAGLGKNTELDNMNDYYKVLESNGKWKKAGKWALIGLGVAAVAGLVAWGIKKYKENKEAELKNQETTQQPTPNTTVQPNPTVQPDTIVAPVKPEPAPQPVEPVKPVEPTEPSLVDADGKMTVQKGDGPWHLAERYLADKFKNEPEKFANLPKKEQNKMIHKKMMEIVELYKKQLEAEGKKADVRFEERIINGKTQTIVVPVIHPGQKIQVVEILDEAA